MSQSRACQHGHKFSFQHQSSRLAFLRSRHHVTIIWRHMNAYKQTPALKSLLFYLALSLSSVRTTLESLASRTNCVLLHSLIFKAHLSLCTCTLHTWTRIHSDTHKHRFECYSWVCLKSRVILYYYFIIIIFFFTWFHELHYHYMNFILHWNRTNPLLCM